MLEGGSFWITGNTKTSFSIYNSVFLVQVDVKKSLQMQHTWKMQAEKAEIM